MSALVKINCPNYAVTRDGKLHTLFCKSCGATIADTLDKTWTYKGASGLQTVHRPKFTYMENFAQATLRFDDGGRHILNGCIDCLMDATIEDMQMLYEADVAAQPAMFTTKREGCKVVEIEDVQPLAELRNT